MAAVVVAANDQFHSPLSAKFSTLKIVSISVPIDLISNLATLFDVICRFERTTVFDSVDRWFGVSEAEGLPTIWKEQIANVEIHDVPDYDPFGTRNPSNNVLQHQDATVPNRRDQWHAVS